MKKLVKAIITACLLSLSFSMASFAYTEGYFEYTVEDSSVTITGYFGRETDVTVPAMIAGNPVNTIKSGAFIGTSIKTLRLPDTIMKIDSNAIDVGIKVIYANDSDNLQDDDIIDDNDTTQTQPSTSNDSTTNQNADDTNSNSQDTEKEPADEIQDTNDAVEEVEADIEDIMDDEQTDGQEKEEESSLGVVWIVVAAAVALAAVAAGVFVYIKKRQ